MDPEQKRRLVGTVVIVSLVVIFVPMFFEDAALTARNPEVSIPPFPKDFEAQALPLPDPAQPKAEPVQAVPPAAPVVVAPSFDARRDPLEGGPVVLAESGAVQPPAAAVSAPGDSIAPVAGKTEPAKPAESPVEPASTPARTPPAAATPARAATPPSKVQSQPKATPRAPQPAAPRKPQAAAPQPVAPPVPEQKTPVLSWWMIQAGSFDDEVNARNLKTRLLQAKVPAFSERVTAPGGVVKFRVRVGPEKDYARAEEIQRRMERDAGVKGMIVAYP